ncbi:unnamed protein product [Hymenolepis diminuta]|uniref:Uncharacterized protein n=1 Tax=Hymenolepis diminuta TaxID=6216 RepID=A0A564YSB8_HYMDI|nr:unnamed protein product [Hymenolepis diminuta]
MAHNPYPSCPNAPINFASFFYNHLASPKSTSALMFSRFLAQVIHIKLSLFPT